VGCGRLARPGELGGGGLWNTEILGNSVQLSRVEESLHIKRPPPPKKEETYEVSREDLGEKLEEVVEER